MSLDVEGASGIGHLFLSTDVAGKYCLKELLPPQPGKAEPRHGMWSDWYSPKEMQVFLSALCQGVGLRNAHIGRILIKGRVEEAGLKPSDAIYDETNVDALRILGGKIE